MLLSEIAFGSLLVYSPRGRSVTSERSKQVVRCLKENRPYGTASEPHPRYFARRLAEHLEADAELRAFWRGVESLVPVPRSSLPGRTEIWPALILARELVEVGVGLRVVCALERRIAVTKAAWAPAGKRPTAREHLDSLGIDQTVGLTGKVMLVDDVVTRGSTLLGAASRLREVSGIGPIVAFAAVRTLGFEKEIDTILRPCVGRISRRGNDDAWREP